MSLSLEHDPHQVGLNDVPEFKILSAQLLDVPTDVDKGWSAYNPSAMWTIPEGQPGAGKVVLYARVEPDKSDKHGSHLGKSQCRSYEVIFDGSKPKLLPFSEAMTFTGEDPALTRVKRLDENGEIEEVWLLSFVEVEPKDEKPNEVKSFRTKFYIGKTLTELEYLCDGPEKMKDIRIVPAGDPEYPLAIDVYGRPQTKDYSGNVTHIRINEGITGLNAETIAIAQYIDESFLPVGSGIWGGVNDGKKYNKNWNILGFHEAWCVDAKGNLVIPKPKAKRIKKVYDSLFAAHSPSQGIIKRLGIVATADMFENGEAKADASCNLEKVTFFGGGKDGGFDTVSLGVRDNRIGIVVVEWIAKDSKMELDSLPEPHLTLVAGQ